MTKKKLTYDLFNIDILTPTDKDVIGLKPVTDTNIFETNSKIFRKGGLYDPEIFGRPGTEERSTKFGYIDLYCPLLHPLVFTTLMSLNSLYPAIADSRKYARYDAKIKDFVLADAKTGETGYTFLINNIHKIKFDPKSSDKRKQKVEIVQKYCGKDSQMTKLLVLPAGLREYQENEKTGRPEENEVNDHYKKILNLTSMLKNINFNNDYKVIDPVRLKLQKCLVELYEYFKTLIDGKTKFIQGKFARRNVLYGTRNVITPMDNNITDLTKPDMYKINTINCGLFQYVKAIAPITTFRLRELFVKNVLNENNTSAYLVDPKSLKTTLVEVSVKKRDEWLTTSGINDIMNKLKQPDIRDQPVVIDKWYLMLVHDDGKTVRLIYHTDDIPEDLDKKYLRPITYTELFYLTIYDTIGKYPAFATRYPVVDTGGIYPCKPYVKTTIKGRTITLIARGQEREINEYPILGQLHVQSLSPHNTRLARLAADFDGDLMSLNVLFTKESIDEIEKFMNSKEAYISGTGQLLYSSSNDISNLVLSTLTE